MSFSTQLLSLLSTTITVTTRGASNNYGEPAFTGTATTYAARVVEKPGFVRSAEGEDIGYWHTIWARSTGSVSITATDKVTWNGTSPPVVAVERYPDEDGENHVKIHLGH